jgi:hypothetical protein
MARLIIDLGQQISFPTRWRTESAISAGRRWDDELDLLSDILHLGMGEVFGYMTWMAWDNPNYNVHIQGGSLTFAW